MLRVPMISLPLEVSSVHLAMRQVEEDLRLCSPRCKGHGTRLSCLGERSQVVLCLSCGLPFSHQPGSGPTNQENETATH